MKILVRLFSSLIACLALTTLAAISAAAQTTTAQDATAATLLRSSLAAMTNGVPLSDITFQIAGAQSVGPDTGTATGAFYARLDGNTRLDFDSGDGVETECHLVTDGRRSVYRRNPAGKVTKGALHAAWISNIWLAPPLAISRVLQYPEYRFAYKGRQTLDGKSVEQITVFIDDTSQDSESEALTSKLSKVDVYLDATTLLPSKVSYNVYSDKSFAESIPLELRYSNFATSNGVLVPRNITAYFNYGPWRLYQASSLQINAGIADATFSLAGGAQ